MANSVGESAEAPDGWEKAGETRSRETLDLKLPCWERGRRERRLIHEPLEDTESLAFSAIGRMERSAGLTKDWRRLEAFGGVTWLPAVRGGRDGSGGLEVRGPAKGSDGRWKDGRRGGSRASVESAAALLVLGRDDDVGSDSSPASAISSSSSKLGWGGALDSAGWPKTTPVAAAATAALVPAS